MKKNFIKILSLLLSVFLTIGTMTSCGDSSNSANIIKGEFYRLVIEKYNYYPQNITAEKMDEADDYSLEAKAIEYWDLLPENLVDKGLEEGITREEAALLCLNTLSIKKSGKIKDVKDAKLCSYPQEMADAVANGLIETSNGYIEGKEKITEDEALKMLDALDKAKINNRYEEGKGEIKFNKNTVNLTAEDYEESGIIIEPYDEAITNLSKNNGETNIELLSNKDSGKTVSLDYLKDSKVDVLPLDNKQVSIERKEIKLKKSFYEKRFKNCKVGDMITNTDYIMDKYDLTNNVGIVDKFEKDQLLQRDIFAGKLVKVIDWDEIGACPTNWNSKESCVSIVIETAGDVDIVASTESKNVTRQVKGIKFEPVNKKLGDMSVKIETINGGTGVRCTASKTFTVSDNKYGNWRDATAHPKATFTASISDIYITTNNLQNFYKKNGEEALFKITSKTQEKFTLECGGLRLAPDSNRNGGVWSNISNSRLTDGKGAQSIKVAKTTYQLGYGFEVEIGVYLNIGIDGKISITLTQEGNGFEVTKSKDGKIHVTKLGENSFNAEANVNLNAEIESKIAIKHILIYKKDIISGSLALGVDIEAMMSVFTEKEGEEPELQCMGYGDPQEAQVANELDKIGFCVNINIAPYARAGLSKDNLIGEAIELFGFDISELKIKLPIGDGINLHFEENGYVDECTRHHFSDENASDDEFTLTTAKIILKQEDFSKVYILESPISDKEIKKNKGIKVTIGDKKIATVEYDEKEKSITVKAKKSGSTEVEIYIRKNKKDKKQYTQTFSITVNEK